MKIGAPKERARAEKRVAMTPQSAVQLQKLGHHCLVQSGAGEAARYSDQDYRDVGVEVVESAQALYQRSELIVRVREPSSAEISKMPRGSALLGQLNPAGNPDLLERLRKRGIDAIAMEMVPRISRAQKMDVLSSMANIAGYRAVIEAGNHFGRFFTGQVTAAGKVAPAKVLVIGAGVAGLAAIGTAVSLGAVVRAFDVRPEVAEQIESMGAEFLALDFDEDGAGEGGYAAPSSPEFRAKQLALFREQAAEVDIVITTALIPNRDAPKLWLEEMVAMMPQGSVVVDLAAERGGNCDLTVRDKVIETDNGVTIVGYTDFPSRMATQASQLYATNIRHMISDMTPNKDGQLYWDMDDVVVRNATVTHDGALSFPPPPLPLPSPPAARPPEPSAQERLAQQRAQEQAAGQRQLKILIAGGGLMGLIGLFAPASFMQHFIVFVLACFVGFQVIWKVSHALHTPLMAVTNAISGIIVIGALLQVGSSHALAGALASVAVFIATINIVGGFMVTRRMLAMFQRSEEGS